MAKLGRPGIPYEQFVETWQQLLKEERANVTNILAILGGSRSTITNYHERYEREQAVKEYNIINSIELSEAVHQAIAGVKVKEIDCLKKENMQLKSRIDGYLTLVNESEEKLAAAKVDLDDAKVNSDLEKLSLERKLAAAEARIEEITQREQTLLAKYEALSQQYNQAKQAAAVAQKEVDMLREQKNTKD